MNSAEKHSRPGLPGEVFQPRDNGVRTSPPQGGSGLSPAPVPSTFLKNQLLSYLGDLAETEDILTNLSQIEGSSKTKLEFCRDRVQRVKDALLRTITSQH